MNYELNLDFIFTPHVSRLTTFTLTVAPAAGFASKRLATVPVRTPADLARLDNARLAFVALAVEHNGVARVRHCQICFGDQKVTRVAG